MLRLEFKGCHVADAGSAKRRLLATLDGNGRRSDQFIYAVDHDTRIAVLLRIYGGWIELFFLKHEHLV